MKHVQKFAFGMLALMVVGCGGSGNSSSPVTTKVMYSTPRVEAIVKVQTTNLLHPKKWTAAQLLDPETPFLQQDLINPYVFGAQDPMNIEAGEQMVFQLVSYQVDPTTGKYVYNAAGLPVRKIYTGVTFSNSDQSNTYGKLSANTGEFTAGATPTSASTNLEVTAFYNGVTYQANYAIRIAQARLIGSVLAQGTSALVTASPLSPQPQVQFFDGTGALVDTVTVQYDGTFRASVPTTTAVFTVVADTVPKEFFQAYNYISTEYTAGVIGCSGQAPVQTGLQVGINLLGGSITAYGQPILLSPNTGGSAPGSTGCPTGP